MFGAALAAVLLGLGVLRWGTHPDPDNSLLVALGSTLVSLGGITIVAEVLLRNVYTWDLLEIVGLERSVYESGLYELSDESQFDWRWVFESHSKEVRVALLSPSRFRARDWPNILTYASQRDVDIEIFFPKPGTQSAVVAAGLIGIDAAAYDNEVETVMLQLVDNWRDRKAPSGPTRQKSTLTIRTIPTPITYSLILCGDHRAFTFQGLGNAASPMVIAFAGPNGGDAWWRDAERACERYSSSRDLPYWTDRSPSADPSRDQLDLVRDSDGEGDVEDQS